ncbi:dATP/dGTP pyrophosphohydrolase domain-containing protein [Halomonas koreensis]|uniref:DUF550 domain-containing protein n=1 Tax=Halomonas koreensis TaxID=245385 RepID=A0ABU1G2S6_9GAMM|nr:dATP/dGTP pyrophosphohydrolase domain-containing protein [Halomonas koreensis]MDR5867254.1 DUF550 domain-containing protein [Halomonas koreensis]
MTMSGEHIGDIPEKSSQAALAEQHGALDAATRTGIDPEKLLALAKKRHHDGGVTLGWPTVLRIVEALRERTVAQPGYCLIDHLTRQIAFSMRAFGPGERQQGVVDHIRKELTEIEEAPHDLEEWIDVVLLALDGAWRAGFTASEVVIALEAKLAKNESRTWPDWRTADRTKAIEHDRSEEAEGPRHEWDWETGEGERCVKCGDKDWFAGPVCSESKVDRTEEKS